jgi:hypothetical protein
MPCQYYITSCRLCQGFLFLPVITYLIQYGHVRKIDNGACICVSIDDLQSYYNSYDNDRELRYKTQLGDDINWTLSFSQVKEAETTKHVHRLHPYKGKFIPQLVEYFIDDHTDSFKKNSFFHAGDVILDPFSGSGTTIVQSSECGIHAIGIDISAFNALIANGKVGHLHNRIWFITMQQKNLWIKVQKFRRKSAQRVRNLLCSTLLFWESSASAFIR